MFLKFKLFELCSVYFSACSFSTSPLPALISEEKFKSKKANERIVVIIKADEIAFISVSVASFNLIH